MDNDAFQALVRSKVKTTKDIAREAVEEAFHSKKKRKRGQGKSSRNNNNEDDYSSSDESESESRCPNHQQNQRDNDSHNQFMPAAVRKRKYGRHQNNGGGGETKPARYRDRAKERREGTNEDYKDSQDLLKTVAGAQGGNDAGGDDQDDDNDGEAAGMDPAELSKYLGGDEAHTHLVKGLDVALARSVRNQKRAPQKPRNYEEDYDDEDDDDDDKLEPAQVEELKPIKSLREAYSVLQQHAALNNESRSLDLKKQATLNFYLHYARRNQQAVTPPSTTTTSPSQQRRKKGLAVSSAGSALQRSQLVWAVDWHPANLARSWEVPVETSHAAGSLHATALAKVSPFSSSNDADDLIRQMQARQNRKWHKVLPTTTTPGAGGSSAQDSNDKATMTGATQIVEGESEDDIFPEAGEDSP